MGESLLEVRDLSVEFPSERGTLRAVDRLSYSVKAGKTLAIIGESGSGKSVSSRAILGTLPASARITRGEVFYEGRNIFEMPASEARSLRGSGIGMVYQEALTALNPVFPVGWQIAECFRIRRGYSKQAAKKASIELLDRVGIPDADARYRHYPHQYSGGMRQRAVIAMALSLEPGVLIADEPTTALDVTIQAQILKLFKELQDQNGMALVFISHDLGVAANIADDVVVMYAGSAVERGPVEPLFTHPGHPYTLGLFNSSPGTGRGMKPINGAPPRLYDLPSGCPFHPRCQYRRDICVEERPLLRSIAVGRDSACLFGEEFLQGDLHVAR